MSAWDTRADELKEEMETSLNDISIDEVQSEGMTIRIGGKVVKLEVTEEISLPEDEIRAEYSAKLTEKLQRIKDVLNEKMSEMTYMTEQYRQDFEEKERKLKRKLEQANIMPDVTAEHAKQGLSVVRSGDGEGQDALTWLFQGVYWPKFYDNKPIDPKYAKRMISPVTLVIKTRGNTVHKVSVNKTIGLSKFDHYHRRGSDSDCWGNWKHSSTWSSPDDILKIARKAMAVLENVNPMSPGTTTPAGLPRIETLGQHTLRGEEAKRVRHSTNRADERAGITETDRGESDDVWST
jgi:hypothetical protein